MLVALLTAASLIITIFNYHEAPKSVPIWWDLHANPWIYAPRWFGIFFVPVLTLVIPYAIYQGIVSNNLDSHGSESKHSVANIIVLPALLLFIVQTFVIIPADTNPAHTFPARTFVANIALWLLIWFGHNIKHVEPNCVIGIINPWTSNSSWDDLHSQAGLVFEVCGVILFILAFLVPVGWPMLVALLVLWLGPWLVSYCLAYSYASSSGSEPLIES